MAKFLYLASWGLFSCIISSAIASLTKIHPALKMTCFVLYGLITIGWVCCWLGDDAMVKYLKISEGTYYAALIGVAAALLIGGVSQWLTG